MPGKYRSKHIRLSAKQAYVEKMHMVFELSKLALKDVLCFNIKSTYANGNKYTCILYTKIYKKRLMESFEIELSIRRPQTIEVN